MLLGVWVLAVTIVEWNVPEHARKTPRGWASLACLILMASAANLFALGIIGEYLSRIFQEVKGRPTFLIARIVRKKKPLSLRKKRKMRS